MSEITFACALSNPTVRSAIRGHVSELNWKSKLAQQIVNFFLSKTEANVNPGSLRAFLGNVCLENEIDNLLVKMKDYMDAGENVNDILQSFGDFYANKRLTEILESNRGTGASEIIKRVNEIKKIESFSTPIDCLGELDIDKVMEAELGGTAILPSKFDLIKRATPWAGYLRGQVVQVVAPPGVGKSLFLANESVEMARAGAEGYFVALGDMMKIDFIVRFTSIVTGVDYYDVSLAPKKYYSDEVKNLLKKLRITVLPSGQIDPVALGEFIENKVQPAKSLDYVCVDYDSNFAKTSDSMYEEGGIVYDSLSRISRPMHAPYRLVFVASQPKTAFWNNEELPMECAAESSRKQAIIDLQITIGRSPQIKQCKAGVMKVGKARRGKVNEKSWYKVEDCGRLKEIEQSDYALLKSHEG
ncbi:DNA primase/helicase protein [Rhizobium phage RHph_TM39]|uniref:DNA primase/helicase protein n=2 Tax=Cuauhnahuacvirus TaxID=3044696 RepID=A0A7S5RIE2_9CAUD|nr:DnaB-like replicative helicase [Rhizobium phage RHph_TM30]YP_010671370.1 DnaB-like replicative helicase [Rhizobium phage RHph_Y65]QIG71692.1 DNA primase/helicase protein [Rhizobium phage RHph_TM40]QIG72055.1 DNA primase/helicase protein [Rhizobium phage RHph_TM2_3B]QIG72417.1 DNA primase/helicase protein [Rhizobium phage RHph_TM3_3_6]QIG77197.1 DNA primase/helicase protein [Rhizobium phage RHph_TM39]QIG77511.1 DNA primase/helicase protein [Rhizobium phage RHph_TM21B]QIG77808.1 DNA primase